MNLTCVSNFSYKAHGYSDNWKEKALVNLKDYYMKYASQIILYILPIRNEQVICRMEIRHYLIKYDRHDHVLSNIQTHNS